MSEAQRLSEVSALYVVKADVYPVCGHFDQNIKKKNSQTDYNIVSVSLNVSESVT